MFLRPSSHRIKLLVIMAAMSALLTLEAFGEDAESVYKEGVAKLRLAQTDHSALVPATKLLAQAAALFEAAGDDAKSAEVNSCLYWAKKKMTLADTQAIKGNAEVAKRLVQTEKEIPVNEAEAMLKRADAFAQGHADDPLLIAIRYYEVGDRFKDNEFGRKAIELTLKYMQQVGEKGKVAEYKPVATDGKAFIVSDPVGAAIILVDANGRQDTGKKTPSLIQLPKGKQTVSLEKDGMKPAVLEVVIGDAITKPGAVKLDPVLIPVDILFDDGWQVFINGKPVVDGAGKAAVTPCTIDATLGKHTLLLAKEGFQDLSQAIEVKEQSSVEVKQKPIKGVSVALKAGLKPAAVAQNKNAMATLASIGFKDNIGTTVGEIRNGKSTHNNKDYHLSNVPKELEGKALTQLSSGGVGPMYFEFSSAGSVVILVDERHGSYKAITAQLLKVDAQKFPAWKIANEHEAFEAWIMKGTPGKSVDIPSYVLIVAEEIKLLK